MWIFRLSWRGAFVKLGRRRLHWRLHQGAQASVSPGKCESEFASSPRGPWEVAAGTAVFWGPCWPAYVLKFLRTGFTTPVSLIKYIVAAIRNSLHRWPLHPPHHELSKSPWDASCPPWAPPWRVTLRKFPVLGSFGKQSHRDGSKKKTWPRHRCLVLFPADPAHQLTLDPRRCAESSLPGSKEPSRDHRGTASVFGSKYNFLRLFKQENHHGAKAK